MKNTLSHDTCTHITCDTCGASVIINYCEAVFRRKGTRYKLSPYAISFPAVYLTRLSNHCSPTHLMCVVTMYIVCLLPVNDFTSHTIQQLPAGRSEVVPSLPTSCYCMLLMWGGGGASTIIAYTAAV